MADPIETPATTVWYDDGIIRIRTKGIRSNETTLAATFDAVREVTGGAPGPVLADARAGMGWAPDAWGAFISGAAAAFTAIAVLVDPDDPDGPDPGSFREVIEKLFMPFRLFTDESAAVEFLRSV